MRHATRTALFAGVVLAACSSSSPALSDHAAASLRPIVASVRTAAADHDPGRARDSLVQLRRAVAELEGNGQISSRRAAAILDRAAKVDAELDLASTTTTSPPTTTPAPTPGNHGKNKGKKGGE